MTVGGGIVGTVLITVGTHSIDVSGNVDGTYVREIITIDVYPGTGTAWIVVGIYVTGTITGEGGRYVAGGKTTLEIAGIVGIVTTIERGNVDGTFSALIMIIVENDGTGTYGTVVGTAVIGTITGDVGKSLCGGIVIDEIDGIVGMITSGTVETISCELTIPIDGYPGTGKYSTLVGIESIGTTTGEYGKTDVGGIESGVNVKTGIVEIYTGTTPVGNSEVGIDGGTIVVCDGLTTIV